MQALIRYFHVLDYVVGAGTVAYGAYQGSPVIAGLGLVGLALARVNVADKLSRRLQGYFLKRRTAPQQAKYEPLPELDDAKSGAAAAPHSNRPTADYSLARLQVGTTRLGASRHSALRTTAHLNHHQKAE